VCEFSASFGLDLIKYSEVLGWGGVESCCGCGLVVGLSSGEEGLGASQPFLYCRSRAVLRDSRFFVAEGNALSFS
jgi:hypothetical protein